MNCCQDCFGDENLNELDKELIKERRNNCLRAFYLVFLFMYSLVEFILAIIANQNFQNLPYQYNDLMKNWHSDPVLDIVQQFSNGTCPLNYKQVFLLTNSQGKSLTSWWDGTQGYGLCYSRQIGYNFVNIHPTEPKCDYNTQQVCGGTEIQMKTCAPLGSNCPINNLIFVNNTQYKNMQIDKYRIQIQLNPNLWLLGTALDNQMPISEFRVSTSNFSCSYTNNDYQQVFFGLGCSETDNRYQTLSSVDLNHYKIVNNVSLNQTFSNNVSLYSRSYIEWTLQCRQKNLVQRALSSQDNFNTLERLQLILIIVNLIFFGITGCLYGILTVFRLTWNLEDITDKVIGESMWHFKILSQIAHMVLVLMVFAYSIDQRIFFDQVLYYKCSDNYTMSVFINIRDNLIQKFFPYDLAIFILFIVHIFIEILACYLFVHQAIRRKKRKSKPTTCNNIFQKFQKDELNAHNNSISYILKPAFNQNEYKQNQYQKEPTQQTIQKELISYDNININLQNQYLDNQYKSIPLQQLSRSPSQKSQNGQNITTTPPLVKQEIQIQQSPQQNLDSQNGVKNLLQFESFSGSGSNKNQYIHIPTVAPSNFTSSKNRIQEVIQEEQDENKEENRDYEFGIMSSVKMQSLQTKKKPELPVYQPRFYQT